MHCDRRSSYEIHGQHAGIVYLSVQMSNLPFNATSASGTIREEHSKAETSTLSPFSSKGQIRYGMHVYRARTSFPTLFRRSQHSIFFPSNVRNHTTTEDPSNDSVPCIDGWPHKAVHYLM